MCYMRRPSHTWLPGLPLFTRTSWGSCGPQGPGSSEFLLITGAEFRRSAQVERMPSSFDLENVAEAFFLWANFHADHVGVCRFLCLISVAIC